MSLLSGLRIRPRRALALSERQTECVEDGLIWALNCIGSFVRPPVRLWVAKQQRSWAGDIDVSPTATTSSAERIWAHLAIPVKSGEFPPVAALEATILVCARLISLSEHRGLSWWSNSAKSAQLVSLVLGLGFVYSKGELLGSPLARPGNLLSAEEMGYALALIANFSGVEPKTTLAAVGASVRDGYQAGLSYLAHQDDLLSDLQALTEPRHGLVARG